MADVGELTGLGAAVGAGVIATKAATDLATVLLRPGLAEAGEYLRECVVHLRMKSTKKLLLVIAGAMQKELARQIKYLKVENEILRSRLPNSFVKARSWGVARHYPGLSRVPGWNGVALKRVG